MKSPPAIYDSQGRPLALGHRVGRGGEGEVLGLSADSRLLAKLYHKPLTPEHAEKLSAMVRLQTEALKKVAAWPVDTCHRKPGGEIIGFLMPRVSGYREAHDLYSPKSRVHSFPGTTWSFLLHSAANMARAFAVVHEHGHLVADVNHGNVLVSRQATVRLIDCDSFQIQAGGRHYLCEVGVPTHVPPELQGGSLRVLRTEDHDAFGLAVLIFQILFMGRHPYSGRYLGPGDMPLEKAIRENRFAYGASAGSRQMRQPPNTLDLEAVSRPVAGLFERAFAARPGLAGGRPRPREWAALLESVKTRTCDRNTAHIFPEGLAACPWCGLEAQTGLVFFYIASIPLEAGLSSLPFDLASAWARIAAAPGPGAPPPMPAPAAYPATPSPTALAASRKKLRWVKASLVLALGAAFGIYIGACTGATILVLMAGLAYAALTAGDPNRDSAKRHLRGSRDLLEKLQDAWTREAGESAFVNRRTELERLGNEYRDLPAFRQRKLAELEAGRRAAQLNRFLDRYRIDRAKIQGIGPSRTVTLQSYGIETARDVRQRDVLRIPGFGELLTQSLLSWRRSLEAKFVFDPTQGIDPADLATLDRTIADRKSQIQRALQSGPAELEKIRYETLVRRQALFQQLQAAARTVAQAAADFKVL
ncbi:MAG: helix-hairpin-helix domain-containing protein [Thermoanaerobaculia bacterium]